MCSRRCWPCKRSSVTVVVIVTGCRMHTGRAHGLVGVWVWVKHFVLVKKLYPPGGLGGSDRSRVIFNIDCRTHLASATSSTNHDNAKQKKKIISTTQQMPLSKSTPVRICLLRL